MKCTITKPKERTSVVASNYGEALEHKSLPKLGAIRDGWKLKAKYARPVDGYRRWYLVELEWTRWKYTWWKIKKTRNAQASASLSRSRNAIPRAMPITRL